MIHKKQKIQIAGDFGDGDLKLRTFKVAQLILVQGIIGNKQLILMTGVNLKRFLNFFHIFFLLETLHKLILLLKSF